MLLEEKKFLLDILTSIDSIDQYLERERDFEKYLNQKMLRRAVERELEIIGEATNRLLKMNSDFPISEARRIVNLRNWVIHSYDSVDSVIIWGIIHKDLPLLQRQVKELLGLNH
ncbi:HepT-like ribonuclease domain-containing protein [Algoriphagus sp. D3-2-R+10]|uniref:HepT-like ribonuclease domain-containing protein n=1 Tax=Algoriphagus aurantiacus TaxID=3103948 RepID=UPI002B3C5CA4|nr:HepT-like ribonuclease domain-containing protein [Algoriphagus sp. D3-2-R+10]MEB2777552.1 HepT-like ribonuclease domain-containing protein [Algoriphagus sp. D3-2-R+10]